MNCDAIQGYYYARPMPIAEFESKYINLMSQILENSSRTPLIQNINNTRFASSLLTCGIIVLEVNQTFTVIEANDAFFDLIGYTKEEFRDTFNNQGIHLIHPQDVENLLNYMNYMLEDDHFGQIEYVCRYVTKNQETKLAQLSGKGAINEKGEEKLYLTLTDITSFADTKKELQKERDFNLMIASLTQNAFFNYDVKADIMRFSKNFAHKFNIPEIVINYRNSNIRKLIFLDTIDLSEEVRQTNEQRDEMSEVIRAQQPDGTLVNFWCTYSHTYNGKGEKTKTIAKLKEISER